MSKARLAVGAVATALSLGIGASVARAAPPPEPLPYTSLSPANGATAVAEGPYPGGSAGIPWTMTAKQGLIFVTVSFASTPAVGSDGKTLSELDNVGSCKMFESTTDRGSYLTPGCGGPSGWAATPGTYYWQVSADWTNWAHWPLPEIWLFYVTPIFTINVVPHEEPQPQATPQPQPQATRPPTSALRCGHGSTKAEIAGRLTCLHSGAS